MLLFSKKKKKNLIIFPTQPAFGLNIWTITPYSQPTPVSTRANSTYDSIRPQSYSFPKQSARKIKPRQWKKPEMAASSDDFSVLVLASDLGVDARPFLAHRQGDKEEEEEEQENWHDCSDQYLFPDEDFSDLDLLQFFRLQGSDKHGNRIFRVVGKYFPGKQTWLRPLSLVASLRFVFLLFGFV